MAQSPSHVDIPTAQQIDIVQPQPTETNHPTLSTAVYLILFHYLSHIRTPLRHLYAQCYPRVEFVEEHVVLPHSTFSFMINALLAFVEIKSQGQSEFPFQTHPQVIRLCIASLIMYGLASAAELAVSASAPALDRTSVYAVVARWGRIGCLCILVMAMLSLFCF